MAFCCGWQRFLPRQRQRSSYSKLIANAAGVRGGGWGEFPPPLPSSALHCFFLVPATATATALAALATLEGFPGMAGNRAHNQKGKGVWSHPSTDKGTKRRGWGSPSQVITTTLATTLAIPADPCLLCFQHGSQGRSYNPKCSVQSEYWGKERGVFCCTPHCAK